MKKRIPSIPVRRVARACLVPLAVVMVPAWMAGAAMAAEIPVADDAWVREDSAYSNREADGYLNARTDADADDNDIILLRFKLADPAPGTGAVLRLTWHRNQDSSGKTLSLYGLNDGAPGETAWREAAVTYRTAPGLAPDGLTPAAEIADGKDPLAVRDLEPDVLTLLVADQPYGPQVEGKHYHLLGPDLDRFLQADTNGDVTFLLVRNVDPSANQARFCQKECTAFESGAPVPEGGAGAVLAMPVRNDATPAPTTP